MSDMQDWRGRTGLMLGDAALARLEAATVAIFGLGGVGGAAAEAVVRAGVGRVVLVDGDVYQPSNLNRQVGALAETVGRSKAEIMAVRARAINPAVRAQPVAALYHPDTADSFPMARWDFIIDGVDMVTAKLDLITRAHALGVPIISVMGTGWKRDPTRFRVVDLSETHSCPLARVMRKELARRGIHHVPVVWSDEPPMRPEGARVRGDAPGSLPWVPPVAGMVAAGYAVGQLCAAQ